MLQRPRTVVTAGLLLAASLTGLAQSPPEFEVASIRRNLDPKPMSSGAMPNTPKGEIRLVAVQPSQLVLQAYPVNVPGAQVVGLPSWATSERYDVIVRGRPDATADELRQMWRTLLANRMKLAAHYEPREVRGYKLVVARADGRLGPQLQPSTIQCPSADAPPTPPPQAAMDALKPGAVITPETERLLLSQCVTMIGANTTYAGASTMQQLAVSLRFGGVTEPIEDHTGLTGKYAYKLTFARGIPNPQQPPDNAPSIFVALQEQLGLKLEPTTVQSQAVVVDQIERPTEN